MSRMVVPGSWRPCAVCQRDVTVSGTDEAPCASRSAVRSVLQPAIPSPTSQSAVPLSRFPLARLDAC
eukprot:3317776-Rhodomonas_salina.2